MTSDPRLERHLPNLLEDLYLGPSPDYRIDVLARVARTRQRPAWTFPGRWIPMLELVQSSAPARRTPWRLITVVALIALLLAASVAVYIGSRPRLPSPFGPAANGLIAYSQGGSIYTGDPVTGVSKVIVTGPGSAFDPGWSADGTMLAFERTPAGDTDATGGGLLYVARTDGTGLTQVTPQPLTNIQWFEFSSDDRWLVLLSDVKSFPAISVASTDGSGMHALNVGNLKPGLPTFRPGTTDIMFSADENLGAPGIYLIGRDGTNLRPLLAPKVGDQFFGNPVWSSDGSQVAYVLQVTFNGVTTTHIHIRSADGSADRPLFASLPAGQDFDAWPIWSPDGTRILVQRTGTPTGHYSVVPVVGSGPIVDIKTTMGNNGANYQWAPDGSVILARPNDDPQQWQLWDPVTGAVKPAPVVATSYPGWQRIAP